MRVTTKPQTIHAFPDIVKDIMSGRISSAYGLAIALFMKGIGEKYDPSSAKGHPVYEEGMKLIKQRPKSTVVGLNTAKARTDALKTKITRESEKEIETEKDVVSQYLAANKGKLPHRTHLIFEKKEAREVVLKDIEKFIKDNKLNVKASHILDYFLIDHQWLDSDAGISKYDVIISLKTEEEKRRGWLEVLDESFSNMDSYLYSAYNRTYMYDIWPRTSELARQPVYILNEFATGIPISREGQEAIKKYLLVGVTGRLGDWGTKAISLRRQELQKDLGRNFELGLDGRLSEDAGIEVEAVQNQAGEFIEAADSVEKEIKIGDKTVTLDYRSEGLTETEKEDKASELAGAFEAFLKENQGILAAFAGNSLIVMGGKLSVAKTGDGTSYFHCWKNFGELGDCVLAPEDLLSSLLEKDNHVMAKAALDVEAFRLETEGEFLTLEVLRKLRDSGRLNVEALNKLRKFIVTEEVKRLIEERGITEVADAIKSIREMLEDEATTEVDFIVLGQLKLEGIVLEAVIEVLAEMMQQTDRPVEEIDEEIKELKAAEKDIKEKQIEKTTEVFVEDIMALAGKPGVRVEAVGMNMMMGQVKLILEGGEVVEVPLSTEAKNALMDIMSKAPGAEVGDIKCAGVALEELETFLKNAIGGLLGIEGQLEEGKDSIDEENGLVFEHTGQISGRWAASRVVHISRGTTKTNWTKAAERVTETTVKTTEKIEQALQERADEEKKTPVVYGFNALKDLYDINPDQLMSFILLNKSFIAVAFTHEEARSIGIEEDVYDVLIENLEKFAKAKNKTAVLSVGDEIPEGTKNVLRMGEKQAIDMLLPFTKVAMLLAAKGDEGKRVANDYLVERIKAMCGEEGFKEMLGKLLLEEGEEEKVLAELLANPSEALIPPITLNFQDIESYMTAQRVIDTMA